MVCEKLHLKDYYPFLGEDGADPTLKIYLPYNMTEMHRQDDKRPCMVVCPGGGYGFCSEREDEPIALNFLPEGFNAFVLTYSVAPKRFPTQLCELAAVMELIYANSEKWNCDTERVAVIGFSAGGHLAAHYSTMFDCPEVREYFPQSKSVNATVLSYPVITADPACRHTGSFVNFLGHEPDENEINYFSCDRQVKENTPPAFLWHTAADNCVPVNNSLLYSAALSKYNIPFELHIYPFGSHGLSTCDRQTCDEPDINVRHNNAWLAAVKAWLRLIFKL